MTLLGNGLHDAEHDADALIVREAELAMMLRLGGSEEAMLVVQENLAISYDELGRLEEAIRIKRDVYSGRLRLNGEEHERTLTAASNYAFSLLGRQRFEEAKSLLRKMMPVGRRVLGESHELTLRMRWNYASALNNDPSATLDDLREAVSTLEDAERIGRRVLGGENPTAVTIGEALKISRAALAARQAKG